MRGRCGGRTLVRLVFFSVAVVLPAAPSVRQLSGVWLLTLGAPAAWKQPHGTGHTG